MTSTEPEQSTPVFPSHVHTVVIGGGIAGLLAARRHAALGRQVLVLEARDQLGGAIAAQELAGIGVNVGAEAYSHSSGAVDSLIEELGAGSAIVSPTAGLNSRLVSRAGTHIAPPGGLFGIPGRPWSASTRAVIGWWGALRASVDRVLPARVGLHDGVSVGDFVRTRMGARVADRLVAPLVGGVHSADPYTLELRSVLPRLPDAVRTHGSLAAAVRALRPGSAARSGPRGQRASAGTAVHALNPTMALLPDTLAEQLRSAGAHVLTAHRATSVQVEGERWRVQWGPNQEITADHLVLACPPDSVRELLHEADPALAEAIPEAPASAVRVVALVLDEPRLDSNPTGTGALVAPGTPGIRAKALTHASAKWPHVREAAHPLHVMRLSYGRPGEDLPPDDSHGPSNTHGSIIELAVTDAASITGVPLRTEQVRAAHVRTWSQTMRQPGPGHQDALARITELLAERPQLEIVGAWRDGTGIDAIVRAHRRAEAETAPASTVGHTAEPPKPAHSAPGSPQSPSAQPLSAQPSTTEGESQ